MDLQKIESFLVLARYLNFTKASDELFKAQSVLSRQIASMEEEMGVQLFYRTKRHVELTPAGMALADGLRKMMELYEHTVETAVAIGTGYEGHLKICSVAGQTIGHTLAPILRGFEKKYPKIIVNVGSKNLTDMKYMLQEDQLDLVCGRLVEFSHLEDICCVPIANIKVCLVASANHPITKYAPGTITEEMFDSYDFLWSRDLESDVISALLARRKTRLATGKLFVAPDLNTMLTWVEMGKGITFLNDYSFYRYNPSVQFIPMEQFGYTTEYLIWKKNNRNACVSKLVEYVREYSTNIHLDR